jgi:CPA2 family monovalent cation:H+ antiporter-2
MVLALVLIPALSGILGGEVTDEVAASGQTGDILWALLLTVLRVGAFVVIMLVVGRRVIPWLLHRIAHTGSRELFRLGVLAIALGVAFGASTLFGVSFALGAFFAGMVLAESALSQQAAQESLPLRDAFAVLFFVSVGMLFDPSVLVEHPLAVVATVLIIVIGKSVGAYLIVLAFGHPSRTALIIAVSLAQIGEFSFILAALGVTLELLPPEGEDLILAGAIISILLNPFLFWAAMQFGAKITTPVPGRLPVDDAVATLEPTTLVDHIVVVGHGRVGCIVATDLADAEMPVLVLEENNEHLATMSAAAHCIVGNGVRPEVLAAANLKGAKALFVAIPGAFEAGQVVRQARLLNPHLPIAARAHSDPEELHLRSLGANVVIMGEREIARGMLKELLDLGSGTTAPIMT